MTTDTNSVRAQRDGHRLSNVPHAAGSCAEVPTQQVPFADCFISPAAREAADRVMASGWVTTGAEVASFEREFADSVGARYAVAVTSCTVGLELALRSLPPASGVVRAQLDQHLLRRRTRDRPRRPQAGARRRGPTPRNADPGDHSRCGRVVAESRRTTCRDGRRALGRRPGRRVGAGAGRRASAQPSGGGCGPRGGNLDRRGRRRGLRLCRGVLAQLYATRNLPVGEGGMITTNDPDMARAWSRNRLHGMSRDAWRRYQPGGSWRYDVLEPGLKANMTDVQAAIGRAHAWPTSGRGSVAEPRSPLGTTPGSTRCPASRYHTDQKWGSVAMPGTCTRSACSQSRR